MAAPCSKSIRAATVWHRASSEGDREMRAAALGSWIGAGRRATLCGHTAGRRRMSAEQDCSASRTGLGLRALRAADLRVSALRQPPSVT